MNDEFQLMRDYLIKKTYLPGDKDKFTTSCYRRLCQVLADADSAGERDIAVLVRNILRSEQEKQGGADQILRVPSSIHWPDRKIWQEAGITITGESNGFYTLQANPWQPHWLDGADSHPPEKAAFMDEERRFLQSVEGDPFLGKVNLQTYTCTGQREAVRAVLTAPAGSTLLVILPTGAGKSLCAHLPGILGKPSIGVNVVVVPTTSLALDQERSLESFVSHPTAYYGAITEDDRERNNEIKQRIKDGSQQIVFTSPESLMRSLIGPVYQAALRGHLNLLVIDEAHMVNQWGDDFRSEFQEIAGLRRDLLRACPGTPFRTLFLSATVTETSLDTLDTLFGKPGPFEIIPGVQIRTEPEYWVSHCESDEIREERLVQAVNNLPRPLILYVTEVAHANEWFNIIESLGYRRIEMVTGRTNSEERQRIIRQWRLKQTDIIVATSAFGLGVDQDDVRAVIHACVPENVDRFYQEVGRGGRDGRACISLLLYTGADIDTAREINTKKIIGLDKGIKRWKSMFYNKELLPDGRFILPTDVSPGTDSGFIDMQNSYNIAWNIRTLTLMSRAGLIELDSHLPPWLEKIHGNDEDENGDTGEILHEKIQSYSNGRVVKILHDNHLDRRLWEEVVEPFRQRSYKMNFHSFNLMKEVLYGKRCIGDILSEAYTVETCDYSTKCKSIRVIPGCGGCPYCRKHNIEPSPGPMPKPVPVWNHDTNLGGEFSRLLGDKQVMAIFFDRDDQNKNKKRLWGRIIKWLISQGIYNVVVPRKKRLWFLNAANGIDQETVFLFDEYNPLFMPGLPVLYIHPDSKSITRKTYRRLLRGDSLPKVLFLPSELSDPEREHCALRTTIPFKNYSFKEIMAEVGL